MRVAIAGAGAVGRSVAAELLENGHEVLLIDKDPRAIKADSVPDAEWLLADACELSSLDEAALQRCDVVIASTGDDKANLVISLLAKTEFAVPRTVGRVNHPANEWLFNESWGVDVSVSTPRIMSALVEEAVTVGDVVRLFTFRQGEANMVELTLPDDSPFVGTSIGDVPWPADTSLVALLREGHVHTPDPDATLEAHDELLFVATADAEADLENLLSPNAHQGNGSSEYAVTREGLSLYTAAERPDLWERGIDSAVGLARVQPARRRPQPVLGSPRPGARRVPVPAVRRRRRTPSSPRDTRVRSPGTATTRPFRPSFDATIQQVFADLEAGSPCHHPDCPRRRDAARRDDGAGWPPSCSVPCGRSPSATGSRHLVAPVAALVEGALSDHADRGVHRVAAPRRSAARPLDARARAARRPRRIATPRVVADHRHGRPSGSRGPRSTFPASGDYVFPEGLAPVHDRRGRRSRQLLGAQRLADPPRPHPSDRACRGSRVSTGSTSESGSTSEWARPANRLNRRGRRRGPRCASPGDGSACGRGRASRPWPPAPRAGAASPWPAWRCRASRVVGRPQRVLHEHAQHARGGQDQVSLRAQRDEPLVLVPLGRVAGHAADQEAEQRPAHQHRADQHDGVHRVVDQAGEERVLGPAGPQREDAPRSRCRRSR